MKLVTINDITQLFRELSGDEITKADALIPVVYDCLRQEADRVGKDLDKMVDEGELLENVLKSVVVDVIARTVMTSTNSEPVTQTSQSALGYSYSATFLNPGGGLFIKQSELKRLGLRKQRYGAIEML